MAEERMKRPTDDLRDADTQSKTREVTTVLLKPRGTRRIVAWVRTIEAERKALADFVSKLALGMDRRGATEAPLRTALGLPALASDEVVVEALHKLLADTGGHRE